MSNLKDRVSYVMDGTYNEKFSIHKMSAKGGTFGLLAGFCYAALMGKSKMTYSLIGLLVGGFGGYVFGGMKNTGVKTETKSKNKKDEPSRVEPEPWEK